MDRTQLYVERIRALYPDFMIESVRSKNDGGQFNEILIVNEQIVFRFPRFAHGVAELVRETALLAKLQGRLPLPIPNPTYLGLDTLEVGQAFVGYRMIPGEPLTQAALRSIYDHDALQRMATQLATFLKALHGLPLAAIGFDEAGFNRVTYWASLYARIREKLFPFMRLDAREWVVNHFEPYLADAHSFSFTPVLKHGDFGTSNILFDPQTMNISGVIDFSFAGIGDPAQDVAAIMCPAGFGEPFVQRFAPIYPAVKAMLPRARFYAGTFALMEALSGIEDGDPEAFVRGIADYR